MANYAERAVSKRIAERAGIKRAVMAGIALLFAVLAFVHHTL